MTRLTHLLTALALAGLFAGATVAACGKNPASPGEMPRLAPRPEPVGPSAMPVGGNPGSPLPGKNARSPVASRSVTPVPSPVYQAAGGQPTPGEPPPAASLDAGISDSAGA